MTDGISKSNRPLKVLVAEDNAINQKVIRIIIEKSGHSFQMTEDGQQALERYCLEPFDLILMDCQMPEMDGLQASRRIREFEEKEHKQRIPIVAMTANAMKGDKEKCFAAGMDDFIAKPFKSQDLIQLLESWSQRMEEK